MPVTVMTPTSVLRRKEAAERLGVHPNTLASWVKKGWLTGVSYPNGETRFQEEEVEALRKRIFENV